MLTIEKKYSTMIKLFGKTIHLGSNSNGDISVEHRLDSASFGVATHDEASLATEPTIITKQELEETSSNILIQQSFQITSWNNKDNLSQHLSPKEDQTDETTSTTTTTTTTTTNNSEDHNRRKKPLKPIPCPRCSSMSTKFCYFNNYNVNQPRHFCKNCQRYWTNGGSMRNVPVGAGRRKSKKKSIFYHHQYQHHPPLVRHNSSTDSLGSRSIALTLKLMQNPQCFIQFKRIEKCCSPNQHVRNSTFSEPSPAYLGKHPRDETQLKSAKKSETFRGGSCSNPWENLANTNNFDPSNWSKGFFKGLQSSKFQDHSDQYKNISSVQGSSVRLQSNPDAVYRSLSFHEIAHLV